MTDFEKRKIDVELRNFTTRNFERPNNCRNSNQIRFYVSELCAMIEAYNKRFNYVPEGAYSLLHQYNAAQNSLVYLEFVKNYD